MKVVKLVIVAVGGQGTLLASRVLGEAAFLSGIPVRMSEIHGMSQRGGLVESDILFGDAASSMVSDGEADILLAFEPLEALRALKKCNSETLVIMNRCPLPPFTVISGESVYPAIDGIRDFIRSKVSALIDLDAVAMASSLGNVMAANMVLLGALTRTGMLPVSPENMKEAIRTKTKKAYEAFNLKAFEAGLTVAGNG